MNSTNNPFQPSYDQVAFRAHQLWEYAGRPEGRDMEFWLAAEREVQGPIRTASESISDRPVGHISDEGMDDIQSPNGIPVPGRIETRDALIDPPPTGGQTGKNSATSL